MAVLGLHCCVGIFSSCKEQALLSRGGAWAGDYTCYRAGALGCPGFSSVALGLSGCGSQAPEHRLNSCGALAYLFAACGVLLSQG